MSELQVIETGEVIELMSHVEAERITARIADKLDAIADAHEQVLPLIGEAMTRQAWKALGYQSPQSYVSERFGRALERLNAPVRRAVVAELSEAGMSTREIAPIVGASRETVRRDVSTDTHVSVVQPVTTPPAPTPAQCETTAHGLPKSEHIIDRRGYKHSRPVPAPQQEQVAPKPRRKPLADTIHRIAGDVDLSLTALYDAADDRASTVKDDVRIILHRWHRHMEDIEAAYGLDGQNETPADSGEGP